MVERGQIDERLDRRARLPLGLRGAVELAGRKAEPAADREHAPGVRVHRDKRAGDLRHLAQGIEAGRLGAARLGSLTTRLIGSTITTSPGLTTSAAPRGHGPKLPFA